MKKTNPPSSPKSIVASTPRIVPETQTELRFIGKPEVLHRVNLSYPTVWKIMRDRTFPRSRNIGGKNAWIESEVNTWIRDRPIVTLKGEAGPPRARVGGFADHPYNPHQKIEA